MPVVQGIIERRLLVNYRVDPDVLADVVPPPFRPKVVHGFGIAGICLIRLGAVRPRGVPARFGFRSENAAHRIAVEWDVDGAAHEGVYIPRRDSNSSLNTFVGGRLIPGVHQHAGFTVRESGDELEVSLQSDDRCTRVDVRGRIVPSLPTGSIFADLAEASAFFQRGSVGYSATRHPGEYDGLELRVVDWEVQPLAVERVASSFFDDATRFPRGSVEFDCALVMRGIRHSWHALPRLSDVALTR